MYYFWSLPRPSSDWNCIVMLSLLALSSPTYWERSTVKETLTFPAMGTRSSARLGTESRYSTSRSELKRSSTSAFLFLNFNSNRLYVDVWCLTATPTRLSPSPLPRTSVVWVCLLTETWLWWWMKVMSCWSWSGVGCWPKKYNLLLCCPRRCSPACQSSYTSSCPSLPLPQTSQQCLLLT